MSQSRLIVFRQNLAPLQGVRLQEIVPFAGEISQVSMHFPLGCNSLVDITVGHGNTQFCPQNGTIAKDDANPEYFFHEGVTKDEQVWCEMANGDGINPHNVSVEVTVTWRDR